LKVTYTEEAIADLLDALGYLSQHSPQAASRLDHEVSRCIGSLAERKFDGPMAQLRSGAVVQSWPVPPFRIYYQRLVDELLIVRVLHQARRPITR
jgi:plasmid stabilization system protein ParE